MKKLDASSEAIARALKIRGGDGDDIFKEITHFSTYAKKCIYVARVVKETRLYRISRILEPSFFILEISRFSRIKKTREIQHH